MAEPRSARQRVALGADADRLVPLDELAPDTVPRRRISDRASSASRSRDAAGAAWPRPFFG